MGTQKAGERVPAEGPAKVMALRWEKLGMFEKKTEGQCHHTARVRASQVGSKFQGDE